MTALWMMALRILLDLMSSFTKHLATVAGSRNTGVPTVATTVPIWAVWGVRELRALGALDEVLDDPLWNDEQKAMIEQSVKGGHLQCYLFECLHCKKHLVYMDCD